ncbi:tape measure protein [Carnimonas bestiolae]|uniref:tape measure protein n=1 Tax=Carnimonas bestiolae TaxID=3402172 RepID=UPI003EDC1BE7
MAESVGAIYYDVDARTEGLLQAEKEIDRSTRNVEGDFKKAEKSADRFGDSLGKLKALAAGVAAVLATRKVIAYSDSWTSLTNQLRQVTTSQGQLADVTQRVLDVANRSASSIDGTANLYSRLARSTQGLGYDQEQLLRITETINKSFAVSGASSEEANNAIIQLGQGLAAGALRGDEFNSVAEQAPGILRAVSAETGKSIGELRAFAATGGITAELLVKSLQNYSSTVDNEFANSNRTFSQNIERANNNIKAMVGDMTGLTGAIGDVGQGIASASVILQRYSSQIEITLGATAGAVAAYSAYRGAILTATAAQIAFNAAIKASPIVRVIALIGSLAGALYAARDATVSIGDTTNRVGDIVRATWQLTVEQVQAAWNQFVALYNKVMAKVSSITGFTNDDIGSAFEGTYNFIATGSRGAVNAIISSFRVIPVVLSRIFWTAINNIGQGWENLGNSINKAMQFDFSGARQELSKNINGPLDLTQQIISDIQKEFSTDHVGDFFGDISKGMDAISKRAGSIKAMREFEESAENIAKLVTKPPKGSGNESGDGDGDSNYSASRNNARTSSKVEENSLLKNALELQRQYNQLVSDQRTEEEKSLDTLKERLTLIGRAQVSGIGGDYDEQRQRAMQEYEEAAQEARNQDYEQQAGHLQRMRDLEQKHYALMLQYQDGYSAESAQKLAEIRANTEDPLKTMGQSLTDSFIGLDDTISGAFVNGVSQGESFNDVLKDIGQTVLASLLQSFVKLGVQMGIQAALGESMQASSTLAATTAAATVGAAWQPAAIAASIATMGGASATGLASYGAAMSGGVAGGAIASGFGLGSGRINGGPVTAGRMYPVTENGKPEMYSDGTRNYLLPGRNGSVTSNKDMQGGGIQGVNVNVHNNGSPVQAQANTSTQNGQLTVDVFLSDMASGGPMSQSINRYHGTRRRVI